MRAFVNVKKSLAIENELIMLGQRVVIPLSLRKNILRELHKTHLGISKTKALSRSYVWWPGINSEIENMVLACKPCVENRQNPPKSILNPWPEATKVWQRIHMDFLGPYNGSFYLIVLDAYSKWPEVFRMPSITSEATVKVLRGIFARFGIPICLVSDNGTQMTSVEFKTFMEKNGIIHLTSPVCHPSSNGFAENGVKSFKSGINKILSDQNINQPLDTLINRYLFYYRNVPHSTTGVSPAMLMFNRPLRMRLDLLKKPETPNPPINNTNSSGRNVTFEVDEEVFTKDYRMQKERWTHGKVIKRIGLHVYIIKVGSLLWKRHIDQIHKFKNNEMEEPMVEKCTTSNIAKPKLFKRTGSDELQLVSQPRGRIVDTMRTSPIAHRTRSARSVTES